MITTGLLGLQESTWGPDAKKWRPSRWLRPDGSFNRNAGPSGDPFGMGHRSCFGQRLAVRGSSFLHASRQLISRVIANAVEGFYRNHIARIYLQSCSDWSRFVEGRYIDHEPA
jgi:hypothetical protein